MKRVLIVDGHPDADRARFCHALADAYASGAEAAGHEVRRVRLCDLEFPDLARRDDWETALAPPAILGVQQDIAWAQHLVILYPLWLGCMPARLKALFEQTFRPGFAFGQRERSIGDGRLKGRSARVIVTMSPISRPCDRTGRVLVAAERRKRSGLRTLLARLGPGLVTGAADDDPSGIGTHSQVGAQFGYGLAWTFVFSFPLLFVIQQVAAQIGRVTGGGIARNVRRHYPRPLLWGVVALLLIANIINLGADLSAMGAALSLLTGGDSAPYTLLFGVFCVVMEVALNYDRYAAILKWTTLSLLSYFAVVAVAGVPWGRALTSLVAPEIQWNAAYATAMVAILGTTISPYLFFWQAGQEIEEQHRHHAKPLCIAPREAGPELERIRLDTLVGMGFSTLVSLAIVFATAATLTAHGITNIETSSQAAEALRPIAGPFAFALFAVGIIGTGLLAVPVLAGSAAYAVTEMVGVAGSLDAKPMRARLFYATIAVTTLLGASLNSVGIEPARALFWAAVVNGVLAAPLMVVMMLIAGNHRAMGRLTLSRGATIAGWVATAVMAGATAVFFVTAL